MSTAGETFNFIKRVLLVDEHMTNLASDLEKVRTIIGDHERRIIRVETVIAMSGQRSRLILPAE